MDLFERGKSHTRRLGKGQRVRYGRACPFCGATEHLFPDGMRRKLRVSRQKVRRHWTRDHSNALWLGDFADRPYVLHGDQAMPTHLSAFIDFQLKQAGGSQKVFLPHACSKVIDVLNGSTVAEDVAEFTYEFATPDTALFELVK